MGRLCAALLSLAVLAAAGCRWSSPAGELRAESLGAVPIYLEADYSTAYFAAFDATETSVFLTDVPLDQLLTGDFDQGLVIHMDVLWQPKSGKTPMDSSGTNVSVRYIVFSDGEVGVYGGAGFATPKIKSDRMSLNIEDASLTLLHATDGFIDLLSPARLTGSLTADLDERRARQVQRAVSQLVTNALGRSLIVDAGTGSGPDGDATRRPS